MNSVFIAGRIYEMMKNARDADCFISFEGMVSCMGADTCIVLDAVDLLKKKGLIYEPKRGVYKIVAEGDR